MRYFQFYFGAIMNDTVTVFSSLKDLGYQQAKTGDSLTEQAAYAISKIVGFPTDISPEARAELCAGYQMRYSEKHPADTYAVIDGNYVQATPEHEKNKKVEKISIGVDFAYSLSSQEFGKLKNTNPALHSIVKVWRDNVSDYCSNRLGDLKGAAAKLLKKDSPSHRLTLDFVESMTKVFDTQAKSVKVKESKQDSTANSVKYKMAVDAFWKAYKV
jgi:hypothetical protein